VDIQNLQDLVRTAVHPKYALADVLSRRVAFHYGNMPLAIRSEIERLFEIGKIEYLVCTSTLLEGVNLPCRNIFMRNPQKGRGKHLSEADFWNLAGRAGRWGKEFQGNIVCIDTDDESLWQNLPTVRRRTNLKLSVRTGMADATDLLGYIRADDVIRSNVAPSENLFSYLCSRHAAGVDVRGLLDLVPSDADRHEIENAVHRAVEQAEFPVNLVARHAGISPTAMQRLLQHFRDSGKTPHDLVLPLPEEKDSRQRYYDAFVALGSTATAAFGQPRKNAKTGEPDRRKHQLANLVVNWMKGTPLSRLIEQRVSSGGRDKSLPSSIRDVMADIEGIARFQAPKYLSCYNDILSTFAAERGIHDLGPAQDVTMLLELGVSRASEVVLMSLGLSRTATIAISTYIAADEWTSQECLDWLRLQNIEGLDLPVLVQREIQDLVDAVDR
jgi:hypothetical protein